ncbi:MAG: hypothetical protein WAM70_07290 [Pyrinomonadaceae bacterium]
MSDFSDDPQRAALAYSFYKASYWRNAVCLDIPFAIIYFVISSSNQ